MLAQDAETALGAWPVAGVLVAVVAGSIGFVAARRLIIARGKPWRGVTRPDTAWNSPRFWSEQAEQAFAKARRRGRREVLFDRLRRRDPTLMAFHEFVGSRLLTSSDRGYRTVPINEIVGSVGKDLLFTRSFYPRHDALRPRWKKAFAVAHGLRGYHPIDLYQVDDAYFVVDGHFRVSVTRMLGGESMQAHVQEWS